MATVDELFLMNLLRSMEKQKQREKPRFSLTREEVRQRYIDLHPPLFYRFFKKISLPVSQKKIDAGLKVLKERKLVSSELVRFTGEVLDEETPMYSVTAKGRDLINSPKSKK